MEAPTNWTLWLVLGVAAVVGYLVVSKIIDFYTKNSTFEDEIHNTNLDDTELIGGHDPKKPIG